MNYLLIGTICVFGAMIFARLPFITWIKVKLKRPTLKPFDCSFCLTGWSSLFAFYFASESFLLAGAMCLTMPFITALMEFVYEKINK
jgi:hypothetical protein